MVALTFRMAWKWVESKAAWAKKNFLRAFKSASKEKALNP